MAGETVITAQGNLTGDPELRFTPAGHAVAQFTVASTPRTFDKSANEWRDGDPLFLRCSAWRQLAENVAESLTRGAAVIVVGRLKQRSYEDREGVKRTVFELEAENVGPSLARATASVQKTSRNGQQQANQSGWNNQQPGEHSTPQGDPWAVNSQQQRTGYSDEPPF